MKRILRPCMACGLTLGLVGLLAIMLALPAGVTAGLAGPQPTALPGVIRVPDDYATIQAAIDAAQDGDTICVRSNEPDPDEVYHEHLSVTKSITLSGGWDETYTRVTGVTYLWPNIGGGSGRAISITADSDAMTVAIEHFDIQGGDATAQGGLPAGGGAVFARSVTPSLDRLPTGADLASDHMAGVAPARDGRAELAQLAAAGQYPGGLAAFQQADAQAARLAQVGAELNAVPDRPAPAPQSAEGETDCGGAIYVRGAGLRLSESLIGGSVASNESDAAGGGLCAMGRPEAGLVVRNTHFWNNTASSVGAGAGGGIYALSGIADVVRIENSIFEYNTAGFDNGRYPQSEGGGVYISAPGASIAGSQFRANVANQLGFVGWGGALALEGAPGARVIGNEFAQNIANATHRYRLNKRGVEGVGGAVFLLAAKDSLIRANTFVGNVGALAAAGNGGGLTTAFSDGVVVAGNRFESNWAGFEAAYWGGVMSGGGLDVAETTGATIISNTLVSNHALYRAAEPDRAIGCGGGISIYRSNATVASSNVLTGNVACGNCQGYGGGLVVYTAFGEDAFQNITVTQNVLADNAANLLGPAGDGGGLFFYNYGEGLIAGNRLIGNRNSGTGSGAGGGLAISPMMGGMWQMPAANVLVDGNIVIGNQATDEAGGILAWGPDDLRLTNNVVAGNRAAAGGGLALHGGYPNQEDVRGVLVNNTIADNGTQGVLLSGWLTSTVRVINNIVVSHTLGVNVPDGSQTQVVYTLWYGNGIDLTSGVTQTHGIAGPPAFVDPTVGDYRIRLTSAARDAGDPTGVPPAPAHDADDAQRPFGARVDIGAYEWRGAQVFMPMVNKMAMPYIGWAVGSAADGYGTILRTTDSGATWVRQGSPAEVPSADLNAVSAVDAANAWVVGSHGVILRTRDGGRTWERQAAPAGLEGAEFHGVKALDGRTAFAVGAPDALIHTIDGQTWQVTPRAADLVFAWPVNYADVDAVDATHAWAVGGTGASGRGVAVIAFFDGAQWRRQAADLVPDEGSHVWIGISALDRNTAWAVGGWQLPLARTTDGGASWRTGGPELSTGDMNRVVAVTAAVGWAAGDYGVAQRTLDGGQSWSNDPTGTGSYLYTVSAVSAEMAWVVGPNERHSGPGWLLRTLNGQDWEVQPAPVNADLAGLSFVGARR